MITNPVVTAPLTGSSAAVERSVVEESIDELRAMLVEQKRLLSRQAAMLEALDHRRDEIEELAGIAMPIANQALQISIERLAVLDAAGTFERARDAASQVRGAACAKPPTLWQLWRRLRTPESRRGLAALAEVIHALGSWGAGTTKRDDGPLRVVR